MKNFIWHGLVVLLLAGLPSAAGQDATARLEGIVVAMGSGVPVADATVTLTPAGTASARSRARTDDAGRFVLEDIAPGLYDLGATGEILVRAPADGGPRTVRLGAGEELGDIRIQMLPTGVISGRILDEEGNAQRGVRVQPRTYRYDVNGVRQLLAPMPLNQAMSDDRGQYRIFGLEPGAYYIQVTSAPGATASLYRPVFYPGTYAESQAVGITVGAGMEAGGIDITLPASDETGPGTVFFRVSGDFPPPERVAGAMGLRGVRGERLPMIPQSAGDGRFSISPPDVGDYDMFMQVIEGSPADRENSLRHSVRVPVTVGREDIDLGTLPLVPAIRIEGVLLFDGTPPPNLDGFTFGLAPAPDETTIPFGSTALPAADGQSFTIDNVPDGRYEVRVNALPTDYFLSRATYGTQSVLGREMVVTGDPQARLELTFATGAATLNGVVRGPDDSPTTGSTVALIPAPGGPGYRELYRATFTDQLGTFSIEGLTPGEYDVYAWEDAPLNSYRNAEFVAGFRNRGERIRVERNSSAVLDLEVIPRE